MWKVQVTSMLGPEEEMDERRRGYQVMKPSWTDGLQSVEVAVSGSPSIEPMGQPEMKGFINQLGIGGGAILGMVAEEVRMKSDDSWDGRKPSSISRSIISFHFLELSRS